MTREQLYGPGLGPVYPEEEKMATRGTKLFTGTDVRVLVDSDPLECVQGISYRETASNEMRDTEVHGMGTLIVLHSTKDKLALPKYLMGKCLVLTITAIDGDSTNLFRERVKFVEYKSGVSVDDLLVEGVYTFKYGRNPRNDCRFLD